MTQNKIKLFALATLSFLVIGTTIVSAQSMISPDRAVFNTSTRFTVTISNSEESSIKQIVVSLPKGTSNVSLLQNTAWQGTSSDKNITWTGDLRSGYSADLSFYANTPSSGDSATFATELFYKNGDSEKLNNDNFTVKTGSKADIQTDVQLAQDKADRAFGLGARATFFVIMSIAFGIAAYLKITKKR